jgi:hypothetical protein
MLNKNINMKTPIGENEIGVNLTLTDYDKIKKLRPYNDITNEEKWQTVIDATTEALGRSKDINILIWFIEANIHKNKLEGMRTLSLLYDLLSNYNNCYPVDGEKKSNSINYLKDNILSWLAEEEILPKLYLKNFFLLIKKDPTNNLLEELGKQNTKTLEEYILNKKENIHSIENLFKYFDLNKAPLMASIVTLVKDLLLTLETFYNKIEEKLRNIDKKQIITKQEINSNYIYNEINKLILQGIEMDKQDILLYLMKKIVELYNSQDVIKIYNLLKEDSIEKILNFN